MAYADGTNAVAKVSYTHQALCDLILTNPMISQKEIAKHFGYTEAWVSQLLSSDAVKEFLIERKAELLDPVLSAHINTRMEALARRSIDVLQEKLDIPGASGELALKALEITTRALGYGAKAAGGGSTNLTFVVAMPEKAVDGSAWVTQHRPSMITVDTVIDG